jgi:hypothetical protein
MTTIISLLLLSTAAWAYCISQLWCFGKLRWGADNNFWGSNSWERKWEWQGSLIHRGNQTERVFTKAPKTWYYKLFNLKYKERFPGSATAFVALTDGYHASQFVALMSFCGAIAIHYDRWFISLIIIRAVFGIIFSIAYKVLAK